MSAWGRAAKRLAWELYPLLLPAGVLVVWWFATQHSTDPFWPPLSKIFGTFRQDWLFQLVPSQLAPTLLRVGAGFGIAVTAALVLGTLLGLVGIVRTALEPLLDFARSAPAVTLIPAAFFIFGTGNGSKIFIVAWASFWPVLLNTVDGVRGVDPALRDMTKVYKLSAKDRVFRVVLPSASPQIFAGLRVALAFAVVGDIVAEMLISTSGVGYSIATSQTHLQLREMWAAIFVLMIVAYAINLLFLACERRALAWHRGSRAAALGEPVQAPRRWFSPLGRATPTLKEDTVDV